MDGTVIGGFRNKATMPCEIESSILSGSTMRDKPKCNWGQVQNAYVPSVTFCHLTLQENYDNSRYNIGSYQSGFWFDNQTYSLPFLQESWKGKYANPPLNGAKQAERFGR